MIIDIETCPNKRFLEFGALFDWPETFDPERVSLGNRTKADTIREYLAQKRDNFAKEREEAFIEWAKEKASDACLSATAGRILCLGYQIDDHDPVVINAADESAEKTLLDSFMDLINQNHINELVGFNSKVFDLPFIAQRMLFHGMPFPFHLKNISVDLMEEINFFTRFPLKFTSLGDIALALNIGKKDTVIYEGTVIEVSKNIPLILKEFPNAMEIISNSCRNDIIITSELCKRILL